MTTIYASDGSYVLLRAPFTSRHAGENLEERSRQSDFAMLELHFSASAVSAPVVLQTARDIPAGRA